MFADNAAKSLDILATNLNVLHNYFDGSNKVIFRSVSSYFRLNHFVSIILIIFLANLYYNEVHRWPTRL